MHLNTIRMEGKIEDDDFLDLCDEYGILVMAGWCCCDHWERWDNWKPENYVVSAESLKDQIRRLRSHACMLDWMNGSDNPPPAKVEAIYLKVLKDYNWPNPYQSSATARPTSVTGATGVKMTGPYEYVAAFLLAARQDARRRARLQHRNQSRTRRCRPSKACAACCPRTISGPSTPGGIFMPDGGKFQDLKFFTEALNARYGAADQPRRLRGQSAGDGL